MLLASYGGVFLVGIGIGVYLGKLIYKGNEMSVEEAIQLLKEKGYWVKINVNPEK